MTEKISQHKRISMSTPYNQYLKMNGWPDNLIACLYFIENNSFIGFMWSHDYFVQEWFLTAIK